MKCTKCGSEVEAGKVYCSVCGNEIRIVPDYNDFEEEIITEYIDNDISNEATNKKDTSTSNRINYDASNDSSKTETEEIKTSFRKAKKPSRKIKRIITFWTIVSIVAVVGTFAYVYYHQINTFTYLYNKGITCENEKNYKKAISFYKKALLKNDKNIDTRMALAESYTSIQDNKSAISMYKSVISLDSKNKQAFKELIDVYAKNKEYTQIKELYSLAKSDTLQILFKKYIVEEPAFSKDSGVYEDEISIALSSPGKNEVYYTLDGTDPIKNGKLYISSIDLRSDGYYDVKAVCKNENGIYSSIKDHEYEISIDSQQADDFLVTPDSGNCTTDQLITITVPKGYKVYYTWDGSDPTTSSAQYTAPISVLQGNNILSVVYIDLDGNMRDVYKYNYICND